MTKEEHDKVIDFVNSDDYMLLNSYISKPYEETIEELDKEIERLSKEVTKYDEILCERNNEVDRLNNIINELEKDLWKIRQLTFSKYNSNEWNNCLSFNDDILPIIKRIKELKEGNINES